MFAYAHEFTSVVIHGLDELGNPTAGTISITERPGEGVCVCVGGGGGREMKYLLQ